MGFEIHSFYCTKCGNAGIPIARNQASLREKGHKKKLYCIHCKKVRNMVECRNDIEIENFYKEFNKNLLKNKGESDENE